MQFSRKLLALPIANSAKALNRIDIAKRRIQSILDREVVSHQKTLEQKIADQGPSERRVDPHLIGYAIMDLEEQNRLRKFQHSNTKSWCANIGTPEQQVLARLDELAPLYAKISKGAFGNIIGDALEVITYECLRRIHEQNSQFAYQGQFFLEKPKDKFGRFQKISPPKHLSGHSTIKEADFIQYGHACGPIGIECKNLREWTYPGERFIKELIIKATDLPLMPVLIARRIHYTTIRNFLEPAGIIAHETYSQYYPSDHEEVANKVREKTSLGFSDVVATETPQPRTAKFFEHDLPKIIPHMNEKWRRNKDALLAYARSDINIAQLYTKIGSRAGGKWQDPLLDEDI